MAKLVADANDTFEGLVAMGRRVAALQGLTKVVLMDGIVLDVRADSYAPDLEQVAALTRKLARIKEA